MITIDILLIFYYVNNLLNDNVPGYELANIYSVVYNSSMARKQFQSSRERFKALAENRTNSILNGIRILSHCSNKTLYEFTNDEIEKIFYAIDEALSEAKTKFKDKDKKRFTL